MPLPTYAQPQDFKELGFLKPLVVTSESHRVDTFQSLIAEAQVTYRRPSHVLPRRHSQQFSTRHQPSKLPLEIREQVYHFVFLETHSKIPAKLEPCRLLPLPDLVYIYFSRNNRPFVFKWAMASASHTLHVCKLIHNAALPVFYRHTKFVWESGLDTEKVAIVLKPMKSLARNCTRRINLRYPSAAAWMVVMSRARILRLLLLSL